MSLVGAAPRAFSQERDPRPTATPTFANLPGTPPKLPNVTPSPTLPPYSDNPGFIDVPPEGSLPTASIGVKATPVLPPVAGSGDDLMVFPDRPLIALHGAVQLQNRRAGSIAIEVTIRDEHGTVLGRAEVDGAAGTFAASVPLADSYWIAADAPLHQRAEVSYVPDDAFPGLVLLGGDLNEDGCIGPADLAVLLREFTMPGVTDTDITGDGVTDTSDLAILAGNFDPRCEYAVQVLAPTPTPTPTESPVPTSEPQPTADTPPEPTGDPGGVLFADSFDAGSGWLATGGWALDTATAYSGAGWWADATARGQVSTLTYDGTLDLRAAPAPQLEFWQQGTLGAADIVAVDISFDGGASWIMLDRQIGVTSGWTRRAIDLAVCRGQVIGLRFRLETDASPLDGGSAPGYWLDELAILGAGGGPSAATLEPAASATPPPEEGPDSMPTPTGTATSTPLPTFTSEPTFTAAPSATPTWTPTPLPVLLPFYDSFDSGQGWLASGAWQAVEPAVQGAGWFADSTPRGQVSLLQYGAAIDLTTAILPRLSFAFRASLAPDDMFSVDVSLDGGISWSAVEQQAAPVTDWLMRDLDLSLYRGYPVRLRFRLETGGPLPEDALTVGVWIDELVMQETPAAPIPTIPPTISPTPVEPPPPAFTMTPTPTASLLPQATETLPPIPTAVPSLPSTDLPDSILPTLPIGVPSQPIDQKPTTGPPS